METYAQAAPYVTPILLGISAHLMVGIILYAAGLLRRIRHIVVVAVMLGAFTYMQAQHYKAQEVKEPERGVELGFGGGGGQSW